MSKSEIEMLRSLGYPWAIRAADEIERLQKQVNDLEFTLDCRTEALEEASEQ